MAVFTVRFWGWSENEREVEMDMREMVQKVKNKEPLYGVSILDAHMQGVAARNSRYSQTFFHVLPWFNFVNHNQVSFCQLWKLRGIGVSDFRELARCGHNQVLPCGRRRARKGTSCQGRINTAPKKQERTNIPSHPSPAVFISLTCKNTKRARVHIKEQVSHSPLPLLPFRMI